MGFFAKLLSLMFFGQIWSHNLDFFKLPKIFYRVVHCYMLITVLMFIFSKFFSFIFFGQICSQNLKFFKLTENWYRGRFLYAYFDFNIYFLKIFIIFIFWANLVPKPEVLQINWNLVQVYLAISLLRFSCLFFGQ